MIRVEEKKGSWAVDIETKRPGTEFALVASAMLTYLSPKEMHKIIDEAAVHHKELKEDIDAQAKQFHLRLSHLLEINSTTMEELIVQLEMSQADAYCIFNGRVPSIGCVETICKKFGCELDYLIKAI